MDFKTDYILTIVYVSSWFFSTINVAFFSLSYNILPTIAIDWNQKNIKLRMVLP